MKNKLKVFSGLISGMIIILVVLLNLSCKSQEIQDNIPPPNYYNCYKPLKVSFDVYATIEKSTESEKNMLLFFTSISGVSSKCSDWKKLIQCKKELLNKYNIVCLLVDDKRSYDIAGKNIKLGDENDKLLKSFYDGSGNGILVITDSNLKKKKLLNVVSSTQNEIELFLSEK